MASITKADLLDTVANNGVSARRTPRQFSARSSTNTIAAAKNGDKVAWPGFGSFAGIQKAATTARNPRTGDTVKVPARKALKFTASSTIREQLNGPAKKK